VISYEVKLKEMLEEDIIYVKGHERSNEMYRNFISMVTENLTDGSLTALELVYWTWVITELRRKQKLVRKDNELTKENELKYRALIMEQLHCKRKTPTYSWYIRRHGNISANMPAICHY